MVEFCVNLEYVCGVDGSCKQDCDDAGVDGTLELCSCFSSGVSVNVIVIKSTASHNNNTDIWVTWKDDDR